MTMEKFYVVVRADLPPGAQATQGTHAAIRLCLEHAQYQPLRTWHENNHNLVLLSVPDESALNELQDALDAIVRLPVEAFYEPDFGNSKTAIAFPGTPDTIRMVASLPLLLRVPLAA